MILFFMKLCMHGMIMDVIHECAAASLTSPYIDKQKHSYHTDDNSYYYHCDNVISFTQSPEYACIAKFSVKDLLPNRLSCLVQLAC